MSSSRRHFEATDPEIAAFRRKLYAREEAVRFQPGTCALYTLGTWHRGTPVCRGQRRMVHTVVFRRAEAEWVRSGSRVGPEWVRVLGFSRPQASDVSFAEPGAAVNAGAVPSPGCMAKELHSGAVVSAER